jgi:hypothetical protein
MEGALFVRSDKQHMAAPTCCWLCAQMWLA